MMIHDAAQVRLGRKDVRLDKRTLRLASYMTPKSLPAIPASIDWGHGSSNWGMMLNDRYGDCTAAGAGHLFKMWNDRCGRKAVISDADVMALYQLCTKDEGAQFDPGTGKNDNGCVELDVLKELKNTGIAGRKIDAFVSVDCKRHELIQAAIFLFGGIYVGVSLPISAQNQGIWRVTDHRLQGEAKPGSWGGHCVVIIGYDQSGLTCVTWGQEKRMSWEWWDAYGDEAYALLAQDWIGPNSIAPSNFNMAQLNADLTQLAK